MLSSSLKTITTQKAVDLNFFGPVYHGTTIENLNSIKKTGFNVYIGPEASGNIRNGYSGQVYGPLPSPPIHHLGYGIYFTTVKKIGKQYAGNTTKGVATFYLDVPRLETINFGSVNTMSKWWIKNGFDPALAKIDRVKATVQLTNQLKEKYDAIWFKGKGLTTLLDGDQVCVFDTNRIYLLDDSNANPFDVGTKVRRKSDRMIGIILKKEPISNYTIYPHWKDKLDPSIQWMFDIKWNKGGMESKVPDNLVEPK